MGAITTRPAEVADAPAMGKVMVESFLAAHRGQIPEPAFHKRLTEWTPDVSARGWARALAEIADGNLGRDVVLVAEGEEGLLGLVSGHAADDDLEGTVAEIGALYVLSSQHRRGIGRSLLRAAAADLVRLGFQEIHVGVLTANLPARAFYESIGGQEIGQSTDDEEGYLLPLTIYAWFDAAALANDVPG